MRSGAFIGAAQVGLLAAVGQAKVLVHPRPRLSIISVGDELVDVARTPGPGQVYDVNSFALAAAARDAGADVTRVGIAPADSGGSPELVEARLLVSEALVIAGAAGGHGAELVVEALSELGELDLTRVAMQPGSAQGFGLLGPDRVPTFLLPANPVSALVVFEVIVRPVLRLMLGRRNPYRRTVTARTLSPIQSPAGRRQFLRGQLMRDEDDEYLVHILGGGGTHLLASLAEANCLVLVDESTTSDACPAGRSRCPSWPNAPDPMRWPIRGVGEPASGLARGARPAAGRRRTRRSGCAVQSDCARCAVATAGRGARSGSATRR